MSEALAVVLAGWVQLRRGMTMGLEEEKCFLCLAEGLRLGLVQGQCLKYQEYIL